MRDNAYIPIFLKTDGREISLQKFGKYKKKNLTPFVTW